MNGLLITRKEGADWPSLPFAVCFETILYRLESLFWLASKYESGPMDYLMALEVFTEEFLENLFVDIPSERGGSILGVCLLRPGFFPTLATYLYNDHIELLGIGGGESTATKAAEMFLEIEWQLAGGTSSEQHNELEKQHDNLVESISEICFYCIDGRSWEIYAKDNEIINSVEQHLKTLVGLQSQRLKLPERGKVLGFW